MIAEREVAFVDFRFTDTLGREHHLTVPAGLVDEDRMESGVAFDGSSLPGWKGIEASDMLLVPDASTARMDPFREETTLVLTCDVVEPSDL
jgi:glutamine synthetase